MKNRYCVAPLETHHAVAQGVRWPHDGHPPQDGLSLLLALWHICSLFRHQRHVLFYNATTRPLTDLGLDCPSSSERTDLPQQPLATYDSSEGVNPETMEHMLAFRPRPGLAGSACPSTSPSASHPIHVSAPVTSVSEVGDDHISVDWLCESVVFSGPPHATVPTRTYDTSYQDDAPRGGGGGGGGGGGSRSRSRNIDTGTRSIDDDLESTNAGLLAVPAWLRHILVDARDTCTCGPSSYALSVDHDGSDGAVHDGDDSSYDPGGYHVNVDVGARVVPSDSGSVVPDMSGHPGPGPVVPRGSIPKFSHQQAVGKQLQGTPAHEAHGVGVIIKALVQQNAGALLFLRTMVCVAALLCFAHSVLVLGRERPASRPTRTASRGS